MEDFSGIIHMDGISGIYTDDFIDIYIDDISSTCIYMDDFSAIYMDDM